jgi:hypothetical protein
MSAATSPTTRPKPNPWSDEDFQSAVQMRQFGQPISVISLVLRRSVDSVTNKLNKPVASVAVVVDGRKWNRACLSCSRAFEADSATLRLCPVCRKGSA